MELVWIKTWVLTVTICSARLPGSCPQQQMELHSFSEAECLASLERVKNEPVVAYSSDPEGKIQLEPHEIVLTCSPGAKNIDAYESKDAALKARPRDWITDEDGNALEVTEIKR